MRPTATDLKTADAREAVRPRRRRLSLGTREALWAYAFLLVPLAFYAFLRIYPAIQSFNLSLHKWNVDPAQRTLVGLDYYREMLSDAKLHQALKNTVLYAAIVVPAQLVLGLTIAVMLNAVRRLRPLFRAIYFSPYVTPAAAVAWVWGWMYSVNFGILNNAFIAWSDFVTRLGLPWLSIPAQGFLNDPHQALPAVAAVVVWQQLGFQVVIFLAGLQGIPRMFYDAAAIDGAGGLQRFRYVTLPLLNPVMVFSVIISTIATLQLFDQVVNINFTDQGGPLGSTLSIAVYMYQQAFSKFQIGYASAVTVLLFVLILIVTLVQLRLLQRRVEY
ncbi:MAG TPA: sugar ABC transporter permease [Trueperaceae bacterium]|nr:sugar ABC transporter permease [Trueperaceae bacterium]